MKSTYIYTLLVIGIIVGLIVIRNTVENQPVVTDSKFDTFSKCLTDAGAKFYGAYWCPHCQDQKKLLEGSKLMPYIECSTPNGQAQLPICADAGITGYPTWIFADGSREEKMLELSVLSQKTNCPLPE